MRMGFTGTRERLTHEQVLALIVWLRRHWPDEFHHGACDGADTTASLIVAILRADGRRPCKIVAHPPDNDARLSRAALLWADEVRPAAPYLVRNRNLVDATDWLTACPKEFAEELRSGTWATVRYARTGPPDLPDSARRKHDRRKSAGPIVGLIPELHSLPGR